MQFCLTCKRVSPSGSVYCAHCSPARSFGGRRCPKGHLSPASTRGACIVCGKPNADLSQATAYLNLGCLPRLFAWGIIATLGLFLWANHAFLWGVTERLLKHLFTPLLGPTSEGVSFALLRLLDRALFWLLFGTLVLRLIPGKTGANVRAAAGRLTRDLWRLGLRALHALVQAVVRFGRWVNGGESAAAKPRKAKKDNT